MRPYAIVTGDFRRGGGMDAANFALARHLARRGHEVHLVGYHVEEALAAEPNVRVHRVPKPVNAYALGRPLLAWVGLGWAGYVAARGGRVVVNGGNCPFPDANWVHYVHAAWRPLTEPRLVPRLRRGYQQRVALAAERIALRRARVVIANSQRTRADLIERLGVPAEQVHTVYCGSDPERFRPPTGEERARARARFGLPEGRPVVAFIGALGDRRKGFDTVFAAWKRLCARPSFDALLVAVGGGAELPRWRARASAEGLDGRVRLLGYRDDVTELLAAADALVAPTRYEAFGVAVLEALCCGLPAWVSRTAGVAERYPAELSDLLLSDPEDAGDLAERLRGWYEAPGRHREALRALSERMRGYTWDDMAREIAAILEGEA